MTQLSLPMRPPLSERYAIWKASPDGMRFLREVELRVLDLAVNNPRRIELNLIWATVRAALRLHADNSFRALFARDLVAKWSHLSGMIRLRERTAA